MHAFVMFQLSAKSITLDLIVAFVPEIQIL